MFRIDGARSSEAKSLLPASNVTRFSPWLKISALDIFDDPRDREIVNPLGRYIARSAFQICDEAAFLRRQEQNRWVDGSYLYL